MTEQREDGGAHGNCTLLRCQWSEQKCHYGTGKMKRRRRLQSIWECSQRGNWGFWERSLKISPGKQIRKTAFDEA